MIPPPHTHTHLTPTPHPLVLAVVATWTKWWSLVNLGSSAYENRPTDTQSVRVRSSLEALGLHVHMCDFYKLLSFLISSVLTLDKTPRPLRPQLTQLYKSIWREKWNYNTLASYSEAARPSSVPRNPLGPTGKRDLCTDLMNPFGSENDFTL